MKQNSSIISSQSKENSGKIFLFDSGASISVVNDSSMLVSFKESYTLLNVAAEKTLSPLVGGI